MFASASTASAAVVVANRKVVYRRTPGQTAATDRSRRFRGGVTAAASVRLLIDDVRGRRRIAANAAAANPLQRRCRIVARSIHRLRLIPTCLSLHLPPPQPQNVCTSRDARAAAIAFLAHVHIRYMLSPIRLSCVCNARAPYSGG